MKRIAAARSAVLETKALAVAKFLKSMANPARLLVLCQLADGEKSVSELERAVPLSQSALSQHLALLRRAKIVTTRRAGQNVYYLLTSPEAIDVMHTLCDVFCRSSPSAGRLQARRSQVA